MLARPAFVVRVLHTPVTSRIGRKRVLLESLACSKVTGHEPQEHAMSLT
jgi:hypothetical protein